MVCSYIELSESLEAVHLWGAQCSIVFYEAVAANTRIQVLKLAIDTRNAIPFLDLMRTKRSSLQKLSLLWIGGDDPTVVESIAGAMVAASALEELQLNFFALPENNQWWRLIVQFLEMLVYSRSIRVLHCLGPAALVTVEVIAAFANVLRNLASLEEVVMSPHGW